MGRRQSPTGAIRASGFTESFGLARAVGPTIPAGITQIFGPPGSGKTSLALWLEGLAQKVRPTYWLKFEPLPERDHFIRMGVDLEKLHIASPKTLDGGYSHLRSLVPHSLVVWDCLDSTKVGDGQELSSGTHGVYEPLVEYFEDIANLVHEFGISLIVISQVRQSFKNPREVISSMEYLLPFFVMSLSVEVKKTESRFGEKTWKRMHVHARRNLTWPPGGSADLHYHETLGFCPEIELVIEAEKKYGPKWRNELGITMPRGREQAVTRIRENPELFEQLWRAVL